jgi:hypothetical protein
MWRRLERAPSRKKRQIGNAAGQAIRAPEFAFACLRTIEARPFRGAPMTLDPSAELASCQINRRERLVSVLATSLGVLIVAAIAVLMGIA